MNTLHIARHPDASTRASAGPSRQGWVLRIGRSLYGALVASGQARARNEMLYFADRCEALQPALAAELRAASAHITAA